MSQIIYQVDSFTPKAFKGNPAGVCILKEAATEEWMKNIAREMNLSETAFLYPADNGYNLRWFTPAVEVELAGHPTLATAHILWEQGFLDVNSEARFHTLSGLLTAKKINDKIEMNFPSTEPEECTPAEGLLEAVGVDKPLFVGKSRFDFFLELKSEEAVRKTAPDFTTLYKMPVRGIIVTAKSESSQYDFISRFFAPGAGIDEDPVTGSAHCSLAPYWAKRLNKNEMLGYQASARGGEVGVAVDGDRIRLSGQAVTVFKIELI